ncbi:MAG: hypothetical protein ABI432_06960 [Flavobacteriales bacterium]
MGTQLRPTNASLLLAPLMFVLVTLSALPTRAQEQDRVVIKGKGIVPSHLRSPLHLTLVVGDSVCVWVKLKGKGRFQVESNEDQRYLLRFEQAGSVTKIIQVDTRFAERKVGSHKRAVEFDVLMEPVNPNYKFHYAGPVGRINFHRSNGRMGVDKNYVRELPAVVELHEEP